MQHNKDVPDSRRHHYVPKTYLRFFAASRGSEWYVFVLDKSKQQPFKTNINNIAVEKDFYRVTRNSDEYFWEHYYAKIIEPLIFPTFQNLIAVCTLSLANKSVLSDEIKLDLSTIICSQLLRTKKSREMQFEIGKEISDEVIKNTKKLFRGLLGTESTLYLDNFNYDKEINNEISLPIINDEARLNRFKSLLMSRYWVVYKNIRSCEIPIITSDHPVVYYNIITRQTGFRDNGLGREETAIFFPINRELIIGLYTESMYFNVMSRFKDRLLIIDDPQFFATLNRLQCEQCFRQAYFSI